MFQYRMKLTTFTLVLIRKSSAAELYCVYISCVWSSLKLQKLVLNEVMPNEELSFIKLLMCAKKIKEKNPV